MDESNTASEMVSAGGDTQPATCRPIVPLLAYQKADVESDDRFRWNCWARQTGKSFTKSLRRILRGIMRRRTQVFLSAGERQCRELMLKARQHCAALKIASDYCDGWFGDFSIRQMEIKLPGGVRIIGLPANPQTARGFTGDVLLDEFAMHADDRQIWAAMFPTLLRGGGELDVASTPRGMQNTFYQLKENKRFGTSTVTLPEAISQGLDVDAEEIRRAMGDDTLYRQEFLCEFLDEATAFLSYEHIVQCCDPLLVPAADAGELQAERRDLYVGVDVGRVRDLTVLWVLARAGDALVTVAVFELAGERFAIQGELLSRMMKLPTVRRCCIDAGGLGMQLAEQAVEHFGDHRVEAITFTPGIKTQIGGALRVAVEGGRIRIPHDERIINDFHSVERVVTSAGHFRLAASRQEGSHADRFWAAALAVHAADAGVSGDVSSLQVGPLRFARSGAW